MQVYQHLPGPVSRQDSLDTTKPVCVSMFRDAKQRALFVRSAMLEVQQAHDRKASQCRGH